MAYRNWPAASPLRDLDSRQCAVRQVAALNDDSRTLSPFKKFIRVNWEKCVFAEQISLCRIGRQSSDLSLWHTERGNMFDSIGLFHHLKPRYGHDNRLAPVIGELRGKLRKAGHRET